MGSRNNNIKNKSIYRAVITVPVFTVLQTHIVSKTYILLQNISVKTSLIGFVYRALIISNRIRGFYTDTDSGLYITQRLFSRNKFCTINITGSAEQTHTNNLFIIIVALLVAVVITITEQCRCMQF